MPGAGGQFAAGGVIGFISGLVGAGGAFISVPFMVWCNVALREAVGTSAALGFPIALTNTLGYVIAGRHLAPVVPGAMGYIYVPALVIVAAASVTLAPVGARVTHGIDVARLKRVFALLLCSLAGYMLYKSAPL